MSVTEILAELPKLDAAELELVFERALELQQGYVLDPSPELSKAIDEADAIPDDQDIDIAEAFRIVKSWNTK
jgi:hypothetical protein